MLSTSSDIISWLEIKISGKGTKNYKNSSNMYHGPTKKTDPKGQFFYNLVICREAHRTDASLE